MFLAEGWLRAGQARLRHRIGNGTHSPPQCAYRAGLESLALHGGAWATHWLLGQSAYRSGERAAARAHFDDCLRLEPEAWQCL